MNDIATLISTLGFPIVAVLGMAWFFYKMWSSQDTRNKEREENLMKLVRELSTNLAELGRIVDENTKVLAILTEKVETIEDNIKGE